MCNDDPREDAMVVVERDRDGTPTVWCDPCLEPLVRALNDAGIRTVASCCGHGRTLGNVALADGRELIVSPGRETTERLVSQASSYGEYVNGAYRTQAERTLLAMSRLIANHGKHHVIPVTESDGGDR